MFADLIVGTIGFEMRSYTAQEESGSAEVCLAILDPTNSSNISPLALAFFFVETIDETATGKIRGISISMRRGHKISPLRSIYISPYSKYLVQYAY